MRTAGRNAANSRIIRESVGPERRMSKALVRAFEVMRDRIDVNRLANALHAGSRRMAEAAVPIQADDALVPAEAIVRDAVFRGGKLAAEQIE